MLSISVFLLLAGWKGVRGGLSQLIYHIKYQPSSALSFSFPLYKHPSLFSLPFSPHTIYISPSHLSPPLFHHFFNPPVKVTLSVPHTSLPKTHGHFCFGESSHLSLFFPPPNNCHMLLRLNSRMPCFDPQPLTLLLPHADRQSSPIMSDLQRYNVPDNTKEGSHARKFLYRSQQWLLTVWCINIPKIKMACKGTR